VPPDDPSGAAESFRTVLIGVMNYFASHPDAKDTADGIGEWWRPTSTAWSTRDVRTALEFLASLGWVTVRHVGDHVRLYGVNAERLPEIKAFLAHVERRGDQEQEE
jgi:hypothetical protein